MGDLYPFPGTARKRYTPGYFTVNQSIYRFRPGVRDGPAAGSSREQTKGKKTPMKKHIGKETPDYNVWPVVIDGVEFSEKELSEFLDYQLATGDKSAKRYIHLRDTGYFRDNPITGKDLAKVVNGTRH